MDRQRQILVVGLGLIGGSLALALQGFEDYVVLGGVRSRSTYEKAVARVVEELEKSDVVILCQDPQGIMDFLRDHREKFRPGSLVLDVCGIKTAIMEAADCLPEGVDFIGCHPMAGKEVSGIDHAEATLFRNTHFIITPRADSTPEHLELLSRMAAHCQFRDVVSTTCARHDGLIAYTSQLMHVIALSVCDSEQLFTCMGFEGGSFRDCTRVAALDVPLWTQLFTLNAPALTRVVEELDRQAIAAGDREALAAMLEHAAGRKKQRNFEQARGDDVHVGF